MIGAPVQLTIPSVRHAAWVEVAIPQAIDAGPDGGYATLRITDDRGAEVPYALDPPVPAVPQRRATLRDLTFTPGRYTEARFDTGATGGRYTSLSLSTPCDTFFTHADVAISNDGSTWHALRANAFIYRVASSGDPGVQTIELAPSQARWIRVRVRDAGALFPIDGAALGSGDAPVPPAQRRLTVSQSPATSKNGRTTLTLDLQTPHTGIERLRIDTSTPEFSRDLSVERSDDALVWSPAAEGTIARFADGESTSEVALSGTAARYLRITVHDGDDAALSDIRVQAFGRERDAVFVARPGRSYTLREAENRNAPRYDLERLIEHDRPAIVLRATIAGEPASEPTVAVPERTPPAWPVTAAFGFAIALLLALTVGALRKRPA